MNEEVEKIRKIFREEAEESLRDMATILLKLDAEGSQRISTDEVAHLFRGAHNIKGTAASLDFPEVASLAHGMEEILSAMRAGRLAVSTSSVDALLGGVDAVQSVLAAQTVDVDATIASLSSALRVADESGAITLESANPKPQPTERSTTDVLRVDAERLDRLVTQASELVLARGQAHDRLVQLRAVAQLSEQHVRSLRAALQSRDATEIGASFPNALALHKELRSIIELMRADNFQLDLAAGALSQTVREVRMVPVATIVGALQRTVREAARSLGKTARLHCEGTQLLVDKVLLDALIDPLMHLLRNAVDHGIEPLATRRQRSKNEVAQVTLRVFHQGGQVHWTVEDDGGGIDLNAVRQAAVRRGLVSEAAAAALSNSQLEDQIWHVGFSTREAATQISGRGVGLDVVASRVRQLGGIVRVASHASQGTRFELVLPLTLSSLRVVLARAGKMVVAFPTDSVVRAITIDRAQLRRQLDGGVSIPFEGGTLPLISLVPAERAPTHDNESHAIVISDGERSGAVAVDEVLTEEELVLKPMPPPLGRLASFRGAGLRGSGDIVAVLDPASVLSGDHALAIGRFELSPDSPAQKSILVVDDSVTSRVLQTSVLQKHGFDVSTAIDGQAALELLRAEPTRFQAVVTDVEMPRLDGIEFCVAVRADAALKHLPLVVLTSVNDPLQRQRASQAGASAYLTKQTYDQQVLINLLRELT